MTLRIIPLGGLGEIGLNMMVYEYEGTIFIVDAGLMFPEDYMLGVDFVIPEMDYVIQKHAQLQVQMETNLAARPSKMNGFQLLVHHSSTPGSAHSGAANLQSSSCFLLQL